MVNAAGKSPCRILVADDELLIQKFVSQVLVGDGYDVTCVSSGDEALELMERNSFDLIITDIVMPGTHNGLDVLAAAREGDADYKVIVITGYHTDQTVERVVELGATDYMLKPFDVVSLRSKVGLALNKGPGGSPPASPSYLPGLGRTPLIRRTQDRL